MRTLKHNLGLGLFLSMMVLLINLSSSGQAFAQAPDTLWTENWEGDWTQNWHVDAGTWEVGTPTSGPDSTYNGINCAATVLAGNYSEPVDSRLIRHTSFVVPPASQNPRLRFWQWYSISRDDYGNVQIKVGNGDWITISPNYIRTSCDMWHHCFIDLSAYADSTVQIAFFFHSRASWDGRSVSSGWYIDDVDLVTGPLEFTNPQDWESGFGYWYSDHSMWQVGNPTSGPNAAFGGSNCAATILDGNYCEPRDTRLISPKFKLPPASESPALVFWHWYSFSSDDYGKVNIRTENSDWIDISNSYTSTSSGVWTNVWIDLSAYADSTVELAFYTHTAPSWYGGSTSSGWYIDNIEIVGYVVNQQPIVQTPINDTTFVEDSGSHLISSDLYEVFSDPDGDALTFSASSNNPDILPLIKNDSLFVESSEDYFGNGSIIVTATDPGGLSARDTFLVEITPVNDAPGVFHLLSPANTDTVDTLGMPIQFVWSQAQNVDQDTIWYDLKIFNAVFDTLVSDLTDTTFTFHGEGILQYNDSYRWTVTARDRFASTPADTFLFYTPAPPTAIQPSVGSVPLVFSLQQNYPNPFNPTTTIKYALPKATHVKLEVFNVLGQKVATLVEERQAAGYHQALFNARNLPSGVYYYRLTTDAGFMQTKKMILMK